MNSKEILNSYLGQLNSKDQEVFMKKYQMLSDENKTLTLQRLSTMLPEHRPKKQEGGLQFNSQEEQEVPRNLEGYLSTFKKEPKTINVKEFKEFLRS